MRKVFFFIAVFALSAAPLSALGGREAGGILKRGMEYYSLYRLNEAVREFNDGLTLARFTKNRRYEESFASGLGLAFMETGDYRKSVFYLGEALSVAEQLRDKQRVAEGLVNLGTVNRLMGNYSKALSYYEDAFRIMRQPRNKGAGGTGNVLLNMADVYLQQGARQKAMRYLNEALRTFVAFNDRPNTGAAFLAFGDFYRHYSEYNRAAAYYESALKTGRELRDRALTARSLARLGMTEYERGNYDRSVASLKEALDLGRALNDPKGTVDRLNELGSMYLELKDYRNALFSCTSALDAARRTGSNLLIFTSLENLARVHRATGDYAAALSCLVQASTLRREAGLPVDDIDAAVADCYREAGEFEKAEAVYRQRGDTVRLGMLQLARKNYKQAIHYFYETFDGDPDERETDEMIDSYTGIGNAFAALGDHKSARENFAKAIALTEEQELFFGGSAAARPGADPYDGIVKSLNALDRQDEALFYAEEDKLAKFALTMRGDSLPKERRGIALAVAQEEDDNLMRLRALRKSADTLRQYGNPEDAAAAAQELTAAREKQRRLVARLRAFYPSYASLRYPVAARLQELKLRENELLLEFKVTDDATYLFMVSGRDRRVRAQRIALGRQEIGAKAAEYAAHLQRKQGGVPVLSRELFNLLFGSCLDNVPAGTALVIVPDELLGIVPFESLTTEEIVDTKDDQGAPVRARTFRYVGDRWRVSYAQSASWLNIVRSRERYNYPGGILSVYDPSSAAAAPKGKAGSDVYTAIAEWKTYGKRYDEAAGVSQRMARGLPANPALAETLSKLFDGRSAVYGGAPAGGTGIADVPFGEYQYVLLGINCILDDTSPYVQRPFFILPGGMGSARYGDVLAVDQLAGMSIPAEVAVLPCSETGPLDDTSGRGPLTAARALQMAGSDNVVLSLWRVPDEAVARFTAAFFAAIARGSAPQEALEQARRNLRDNGFESPYYWTAFVLAGK